MRCPICHERVRDQDALQLHFVNSCTAITGGDGTATTATSGRRNSMDDEQTSELVEVVFRWQETKDTIDKSIDLISSLAGQIKLNRTRSFDVFESAKVIVPCGVHACQLVVEEECYPVIDINVEDSTEVVDIMLQEDSRVQDGSAAPFGASPLEQSHYNLPDTYSREVMGTGALKQDDITIKYARKVLNDIVKDANEVDEVSSVGSTDSNFETARRTRRKKQLEDLNNGQKKDNVTTLAKNGLHQVQVHTIASKRIIGENSNAAQSEKVITMDRRDSQGSLHSNMQGGRKSSKGSISDGRIEAASEHVIQPPNGFQSENDQKQRNETRRSKHLAKIANSKVHPDSLSDQGSQEENDQNSLEEKRDSRKSRVPLEEKPSWGFDGGKVEKEKLTAEPSLNAQAMEQLISELVAKCGVYEKDLVEIKQEKQHLEMESEKILQKSKDDMALMLIKDEKIEEYQARCNSYETEFKRVNIENEKLVREIMDINNENDIIKEKFLIQEENVAKKTEEVEALEGRLESLLQDIKVLKEENESLQTAHKLQQEDMDRIIQDEVKSLKNKLNSVKIGSRSFQYEEMKKITELEGTISRLRSENDQLKQQLQRIKIEAHVIESNRDDDTDGVYSGFDSYWSRSFSPTDGHLSRHDSTYKPKKTRTPLIATETRSRSYDGYDGQYLPVEDKSHSRPSYDSNQNYTHSSDPLRLRASQSSRSSKTGSTGPLRAPHFDYITERSTDLSLYDRRNDVDYASTRERKPRRERPRSYHGVSANESDLRDLHSSHPSYEHEDSSTYLYSPTRDREKRDQDYLKKYSKPFSPNSFDDIMTGMRVLVTRSSGRTGKGIVKWKGYLEGHSDPFIGIELETPDGKNDGVYDGRRYFYCKKNYGVFSKFSKVVMVWGSV